MNCFYKRCLSILAAGTLVLGGAVAMAQEPAEDDLLIMPISANTEMCIRDRYRTHYCITAYAFK